MVMGAVIGVVFASESYLVWLNLIGDVYIKLITTMVAPVILLSVISGFISLNDKEKMKTIGTKSVFWLMVSSAVAIVLSLFFAEITGLGKNAGAVFADISAVSESEISAYQAMETSFDYVLLNLFPSNIIQALADDNVAAIIIIAVAIAVAYVSISSAKGEEKVIAFKNVVEAAKEIVFNILTYIIDLTPYAVLCLTASSAYLLFSDMAALLQLLLLLVMIFVVCLVHTYGTNAILLKCFAKLNPLKFFKKTFAAQATSFTTQSSVGTLPVTISGLTKKVGVDDEVANFTAPLGTTIGMPGCSCIWPILLAIFYVNATGTQWGISEYMLMCFMALVLSLGSAGVPGIGVVMSVTLFNALNLPVAAVILLIPINSISDMARTLTNVVAANVSAAIVARQTGRLNDEVFNSEE